MHLNTLDNLLWGFGAVLKVVLCATVFYRRLYNRLPAFTVYVSLLVAEVVFVWIAYRVWGYRSRTAYFSYWCALALVLMARGVVVGELSRSILRNYAGLWSIARGFLLLAATVLLIGAGIATTFSRGKDSIAVFVLTTERGIEIAVSIGLLLLLAICVRYGVLLGSLERSILAGLAIYSIFQTLNLAAMRFTSRFTSFFPWWESIRVGSFDISMMIWLYALRRPLESPPAPLLLQEQASADLLNQVLGQMRQLANDLKNLGKAIRR